MTGVPVELSSETGHRIEPSSSSRAKETPANVGVVAAISSMMSEAAAYGHVEAHRPADRAGDLPLVHADQRAKTGRTRLRRRSALVKVPSFSRNDGAGQEDVRVPGGLVEEQVLDDDEVHRPCNAASTCRVLGRTGEVPPWM